ncbi:hypothetical protein CI109_105298 [Kwoniella shandongensis]|uniref:Uncharacterized protein n=1 Tax=Kwoniella shandongensis TaxID=1734106 RepID=A0AAJ8LLL6_9TREE
MTFRDSMASNSTSSTSYPSTISSLSHSALGLTDSPLPPAKSKMTATSNTSSPSTPARSIRDIRQSSSRSSLRQEVTTNAASRLAQRSTELLRPPQHRTSQSNTKGTEGSPRSSASNGTPDKSPRVTTASPKVSNITARSQPQQLAKDRPQSTPVTHITASSASRQSTQPSRPPSSMNAMIDTQKPPTSPAGTETTMAEEWEAELVKNARNLSIRPAPVRESSARDREEQRQKDLEWEKSGVWESGRDAAREAEDRVRRDAGREIAYPPSMPRVPIRAAPTGVTSVHVGVRPRLHPSKASDSMTRNQPDPNIPPPLFSPAAGSSDLPDDTIRGSYNTRYDSALAEKAKKEYEDWLAKKNEREGGFGGEDTGGTRDWVPREREFARPGAVEGIAHSDGYAGKTVPQIEGPPEPVHSWGYPYPNPYEGQDSDHPQNPMFAAENFYAQQGYWDPSYWWGMGGYGQPVEAQAPLAEASVESGSGQATPITPEEQGYGDM